MGATNLPMIIIPRMETINKTQAITQTRIVILFHTAIAPIHERKNTATGQNIVQNITTFEPCLNANSNAVTFMVVLI
ncbi:MAG TPA: hypothetical protein VM640_11515 [Desulfitobacterium sp.]|nr:hypothetical protein [Desulfitobacterium sp.]